MPEEEESLQDLSRELLDLIDYDVYKWQCCAEGCTNGTHVRDYGEGNLYYLIRQTKDGKQWVNKHRHVWLCGKHYKMWRQAGRPAHYPFPVKEKHSMVDNLVFVKSVTVTNIKFKL